MYKFFLFLMFLTSISYSQISGKIVDLRNNAISNALIEIPNYGISTSSDSDGNFKIDFDEIVTVNKVKSDFGNLSWIRILNPKNLQRKIIIQNETDFYFLENGQKFKSENSFDTKVLSPYSKLQILDSSLTDSIFFSANGFEKISMKFVMPNYPTKLGRIVLSDITPPTVSSFKESLILSQSNKDSIWYEAELMIETVGIGVKAISKYVQLNVYSRLETKTLGSHTLESVRPGIYQQKNMLTGEVKTKNGDYELRPPGIQQAEIWGNGNFSEPQLDGLLYKIESQDDLGDTTLVYRKFWLEPRFGRIVKIEEAKTNGYQSEIELNYCDSLCLYPHIPRGIKNNAKMNNYPTKTDYRVTMLKPINSMLPSFFELK